MGNKSNKEKRPDLDPSMPSGGVPSSSSTKPNDHPSPNAGLCNSSSKSDNESSNSSPQKTDSSSDPPPPSAVASVPAPTTLPSEPAPPNAVPIVPAPRTLPPPPNIKPSNHHSPKSEVRNAGPPSPWTGRKVSRQERRRIERIKRKSKGSYITFMPYPIGLTDLLSSLGEKRGDEFGCHLLVPK